MANEHKEPLKVQANPELPAPFSPDIFVIKSGPKGKEILDQQRKPLFTTRKDKKEMFVLGAEDNQPHLVLREEQTKPYEEQNKWLVVDPQTQEPIGQIRNLKLWQKPRAVSQEYELTNPDGSQVLATITEMSELASLLNGLTMGLRDVVAPHFYQVKTPANKEVAHINVSAGLRNRSITMRVTDQNPPIDRRMILAACLL